MCGTKRQDQRRLTSVFFFFLNRRCHLVAMLRSDNVLVQQDQQGAFTVRTVVELEPSCDSTSALTCLFSKYSIASSNITGTEMTE